MNDVIYYLRNAIARTELQDDHVLTIKDLHNILDEAEKDYDNNQSPY